MHTLVGAIGPEKKTAHADGKVVAYLSYSSPLLRPETLERNKEMLRSFAEIHNLEIVKVVVEAAVSEKVRQRSNLNLALAFIMEGGADGLLVEDCDRLARRFSVIPLIYEKLATARKQLWDSRSGIIDSQLKSAIIAAMGMAEDNIIRERMRIGSQIARNNEATSAQRLTAASQSRASRRACSKSQIAYVEGQFARSWKPNWMPGYSDELRDRRRRQLEIKLQFFKAEQERLSSGLSAFEGNE